ncbi:MAG: peptide chain release factor N(5)-glutamine methyltransferase [Thermodesulfobacteriota bacterium]|nr:peptide chain release factor N(5)-glutamine methyltransferase [Thermodesulfobacteriota bacterium]
MQKTVKNGKYWTILNTLNWTTDYFKKKKISTPRLDAEVLLAHALKTDRVSLYTNFEKLLRPEELKIFKELIIRRTKREPAAYIIGKKEFWSMEFEVNKFTLIPRPETEILIETAIKILKNNAHNKVLELGTGSGVIAVTLAKEIEDIIVFAVEFSYKTIKIARKNAILNDVEKKIKFIISDFFSCIKENGNKFDLIISNPPYIAIGEWESLPPEVTKYEPRDALLGGEDGLKNFRTILAKAKNYLDHRGWLILEIGESQKEAIKDILETEKSYKFSEIVKDYSGKDRVIVARRI